MEAIENELRRMVARRREIPGAAKPQPKEYNRE